MSVFDGEIEFESVYMVDYKKHIIPLVAKIHTTFRTPKTYLRVLQSPRRKAIDDDCLIVGFGRDTLKPRDEPVKTPDVLCPLEKEFYKAMVQRLESSHPRIKKKYFEGDDIDPIPIEHEAQDLKRTEYLTKYCSRELPFMSVNLARRARALQTLRLPDDVEIPDTTQRCCYRPPAPEKIVPPATYSMRPKYDPKLQDELRRILRVRTGESTYGASVGLLGRVVLESSPYGPPREEPRYGRWRAPFPYIYRL